MKHTDWASVYNHFDQKDTFFIKGFENFDELESFFDWLRDNTDRNNWNTQKIASKRDRDQLEKEYNGKIEKMNLEFQPSGNIYTNGGKSEDAVDYKTLLKPKLDCDTIIYGIRSEQDRKDFFKWYKENINPTQHEFADGMVEAYNREKIGGFAFVHHSNSNSISYCWLGWFDEPDQIESYKHYVRITFQDFMGGKPTKTVAKISRFEKPIDDMNISELKIYMEKILSK